MFAMRSNVEGRGESVRSGMVAARGLKVSRECCMRSWWPVFRVEKLADQSRVKMSVVGFENRKGPFCGPFLFSDVPST